MCPAGCSTEGAAEATHHEVSVKGYMMKAYLHRVSVALLMVTFGGMPAVTILLASSVLASTAPSVQSSSPPAASSKSACLNCHGPFDALAANANYHAPSGEKISPHRHVPHTSTGITSIPGCDNCHAPHPVPPSPAAVAALPKPDVQWCYTACHHKNTFQLCKDCHK
jgi:hypothetical protein